MTTLRRLALLVTGILAAIASELHALGLTRATCQGSIERRLRRALNDPGLTLETCYLPVLHQVLPWQTIVAHRQRLVLIVDESSKHDQVHLFRVSLPYRGTSLPLAWALWPQNQPLPEGAYWAQVDRVLTQVAALLPKGVEVLVLADRAYDNSPFVDRLVAYGWHFIIRCKAKSSLHFSPREATKVPWPGGWRAICPVRDGAGRPWAGCTRRRAGGGPVWWRCGPPEQKNPWWS